jgi:CheY-like chemotaxis protein
MERRSLAPDARKILVVDDNKVVLKAMYFALTEKGYRVMMAESGAETISFLHKDKPDLILLDLDFPPDTVNIGGALRDGFLIIDWARRMCDAEKIPVIIISSTDPEKYKDRAHAAGILTFFHKPVDKQKLLDAIHATLGDAPAQS